MNRATGPVLRAARLTVLLLAATAPAFGGELFVDASCGDDASMGTSPVCGGLDGPKLTIQAAINALGNPVTVAPGTYHEVIDVVRWLVLRSSGGASVTTIDGSGLSGPVVRGRRFHLLGFTVTGGSGSGVRFRDLYGALPPESLVRDCVIRGNLGIGLETGLTGEGGGLTLRTA